MTNKTRKENSKEASFSSVVSEISPIGTAIRKAPNPMETPCRNATEILVRFLLLKLTNRLQHTIPNSEYRGAIAQFYAVVFAARIAGRREKPASKARQGVGEGLHFGQRVSDKKLVTARRINIAP
jgi:hypothetical protein